MPIAFCYSQIPTPPTPRPRNFPIQNPKSEPFPGLPDLPDLPPPKGDREFLYLLVIGSEAGVLETLYELQQRGFANVTDWSRNLPYPRELPQPRSSVPPLSRQINLLPSFPRSQTKQPMTTSGLQVL